MDDTNQPLPVPESFLLPDQAFNDAVEFDPTAHHKAVNAHFSSAWVQGPGAVNLLAESVHDLFTVAALRGEPTTEIAFVRLLALTSAKSLLLWPTHERDPQKVALTWKDGTADFNASAILRSAKIPVESKKRNRYTVHVVKESKVGPVLAIDMRFELESRNVPKQKSYRRTKAKREAAPSVQPEPTE